MYFAELNIPKNHVYLFKPQPRMPRHSFGDLCYTIPTQEIAMDAAENQIVVYQPNEAVRRGEWGMLPLCKCCQCPIPISN